VLGSSGKWSKKGGKRQFLGTGGKKVSSPAVIDETVKATIKFFYENTDSIPLPKPVWDNNKHSLIANQVAEFLGWRGKSEIL